MNSTRTPSPRPSYSKADRKPDTRKDRPDRNPAPAQAEQPAYLSDSSHAKPVVRQRPHKRKEPEVSPETARVNAVVEVVRELLRFQGPADAVLSDYFRAHRSLGQRERGFIAETAYSILRRRRYLERLAEPEVTPRRLVLLSLTRLFGLGHAALGDALTGKEARWLSETKSQALEAPTVAEQADCPDWLVERLSAHMSEEEILVLLRSLNLPAPLDLRVNTLKADRAVVLAALEAEGIAATATPHSPFGIRLAEKPALQTHPLYVDGTIEVQDEGSQLLGLLLAPKRGEMVADFCAGAGGKTLLIGAMMRTTGRLYAFDVATHRILRLRQRAARAGLSNIQPIVIAHEADARLKRLAGKMDRVLVDAPCSGMGTLRRNPDLKWRQTPQTVLELTTKQQSILNAAAKLVKPGGRLVYATCSILFEENEAIVADFLATHPDFSQLNAQETLAAQSVNIECGESLRLSPAKHGTDGFFAVLMQRKEALPPKTAEERIEAQEQESEPNQESEAPQPKPE